MKHIINVYEIFDEELEQGTKHILVEFKDMNLTDCYSNGNSIKFPQYQKEVKELNAILIEDFGKNTFKLYGTRELNHLLLSSVLNTKQSLDISHYIVN